ncbi:hypothetical protein FISHEDRAFT_78293 [Fistulina hepatica ATCC 64428]|nr:hypothetical protein FISHEDRAFT_78293 [Fistulina hepatica ATCC 64428]
MADHPAGDTYEVEGLYFEDGNIVLQADRALFRLYKGLLAARSTFFCDMLSFPQPEKQELFRDCPLVVLHDDPQDATQFLRAIFDSSFFEKNDTTTFEVVAGILRLSTKYDVPYLRQRALSHLLTVYPPTLQEWEERTVRRTIPPTPNIAIAALELARATHVTEILPAVMYACSSGFSVTEIFDGVAFEDRVIRASPQDQRSLILGRDKLIEAKRKQVFGFLTLNPMACRSVDCQMEKLKSYSSMEWDANVFDLADFNKGLDNALCRDCLAHSKLSFSLARKEIWCDLPKIFSLSPAMPNQM